MISLPADMLAEVKRMNATGTFLWLWHFVVNETTSQTLVMRLAEYDQDVTWNSKTWRAYPMEHSEIQVGTDGDLPRMSVTLHDPARFVAALMESGQGFVGNDVTTYLVHKGSLGASDYLTWKWRVSTATVAEVVTFQLVLAGLNDVKRPADTMSPNRCRHRFGGEMCGYVLNAAAAYTDCDKTMADCILRGQDMEARNLPKLQPGRFGGFPGLPEAR